MGKLKGKTAKLHVDQSVAPAAQPCRRIPFGHKDLAKVKLKQMVKKDIIEAMEGPTPWGSPLVTVAKDTGKGELLSLRAFKLET